MELDKEYKMKMLYHWDFWDHPRSGLGEHNGQKVWFQIESEYEYLKEENYTPEIKSIIDNYKFNEEDDEIIDSIDDYDIYYWPEWHTLNINGEKQLIPAYFTVQHKLTYKMYRLPSDVMKEVDEHQKFIEECGFFNSWHDPVKFKPYNGTTEQAKKYHEESKTRPKVRVGRDDLVNYECLGTVKCDEIEWFQRPWNLKPA